MASDYLPGDSLTRRLLARVLAQMLLDDYEIKYQAADRGEFGDQTLIAASDTGQNNRHRGNFTRRAPVAQVDGGWED